MEDITKGKKKRKKARRAEDYPTPQHAAAEGFNDDAMRKGMNSLNIVDNSYDADRLSEPLTRGHQSPSTGDHGRNAGRNADVAHGHDSLRQSSMDVEMFARRTQNPVTFVGQAAFHSAFSDTDAPPGADGGRVTVQRLNVRDEAGSYSGMDPVSYHPGDGSRDYGQHRTSATADNGSHNSSSQAGACSTPREAMKGESPISIMKRTQRRVG